LEPGDEDGGILHTMTIGLAHNTPTQGESFASQLQTFRSAADALATRSDTLGETFGQAQTESYAAYNATDDGYENAVDASHDNATNVAAGSGTAILSDLTTINSNQTALNNTAQTATPELAFCQTEVGRLCEQLTALAAAAPQGPVAASLQQALTNLKGGGELQAQVAFDPSEALAEAPELIGIITDAANQVAADTAGTTDVSGQGAVAMESLSTLQGDYGELGNIAGPASNQQLTTTQYYQATVSWVDQALTELGGTTVPTP
jgi:hypothetical protein